MSLQVNGLGNDYAARLYQTRLQTQTRHAQDTPVEAVQSVSRAATSTETSRVSRTSSVLTADQVQFSQRAQQVLAQSSSTSTTYGTALASADTLAGAVPHRGQILKEQTELPTDVSAVSAVRRTAARQNRSTGTSSNQAVQADSGTTFEGKLQSAQLQANEKEQNVLSKGMQRYLQIQSNVSPQVQTTAVAMNLLA
ncbi:MULTISPECIES: hypothetical protein [Caproicibacterium]|uniref:Uncharacterized protein n=1 Tax=Caproicibacterium argilliputei TaxID=3030016 RepID=A0AA97DBA4_9FIRM|nr:hypothetical protein [Caproicibacterium argilliputei]WOC33249.1 hypothetical protein PXC00_05090 [Caproicibacterium argilliputei]